MPWRDGTFQLVTQPPEPSNLAIRLLPMSATYTFPTPSAATSSGLDSCPGPAPEEPHFATKPPFGVNTWIRLLAESATATFPFGSVATPHGLLSWPSAAPGVPHAFRRLPF